MPAAARAPRPHVRRGAGVHPHEHRAAATVPTPIGELLLVSDGDALVALRFDDERRGAPTAGADRDPVIRSASAQLRAYFAGERTAFDVPLRPGGTPFERRVWDALREIPYGETTSYGAIAARIGEPGAARAVGRANGRNPHSGDRPVPSRHRRRRVADRLRRRTRLQARAADLERGALALGVA